MGRELRRVPPNWEHPKEKRLGSHGMVESYQPMLNSSYLPDITDWIKQHTLWEQGTHPDQLDESTKEYRYYAQWAGNPPSVQHYRPDWKPEEMTWYQVYETVSEGTPVSPPFATREELVEYLVANGDFWDQRRRAEGNSGMRCSPWTRQQAVSFVFGDGWVPSMVLADGKVLTGVEALTELDKPKP